MTMKLTFLSFAEILEIHEDQLERYGGESGLRDVGLLKSAISMPSATYGGEFLHSDIYEMAAAYIFHIVQNHPFVDGNKRTGAVAALVFLVLNGYDFDAPEDELAETILNVASGKLSKPEIALFIRRWAVKG
jgi:death-on-curing protein